MDPQNCYHFILQFKTIHFGWGNKIVLTALSNCSCRKPVPMLETCATQGFWVAGTFGTSPVQTWGLRQRWMWTISSQWIGSRENRSDFNQAKPFFICPVGDFTKKYICNMGNTPKMVNILKQPFFI